MYPSLNYYWIPDLHMRIYCYPNTKYVSYILFYKYGIIISQPVIRTEWYPYINCFTQSVYAYSLISNMHTRIQVLDTWSWFYPVNVCLLIRKCNPSVIIPQLEMLIKEYPNFNHLFCIWRIIIRSISMIL